MNQWFQQDVFLQPFPLVTTSWMFSKMGPKQFTIFCVSISVAKQWLSSNMVFERSTKRCPFWWSASPTKLPSSKNWIFMGKTSYSDWWFGICFIFHFIYGMSSFQLTFTPWKILHQTMFGGYPKMGWFFWAQKRRNRTKLVTQPVGDVLAIFHEKLEALTSSMLLKQSIWDVLKRQKRNIR